MERSLFGHLVIASRVRGALTLVFWMYALICAQNASVLQDVPNKQFICKLDNGMTQRDLFLSIPASERLGKVRLEV